jgi:hypothetical protein
MMSVKVMLFSAVREGLDSEPLKAPFRVLRNGRQPGREVQKDVAGALLGARAQRDWR